MPLAIDDRFSTKIKINMSSSVIHIPTDVFSGGELVSHVMMQVSLASPLMIMIMIMNLYSAKTIKECSKALYINLKFN